ncbi:MAG: 1-deoxy-D-xylulose-5-phosphate reductoisomerase [Alphaproteobacteria bacterium]|jgi:1-deoxy-D-xylulose-5-phosphate reductoisomerase|nr:1-deoxy-D-xylulose-5-phosphate reductoisomerase [Alphaproteobacteria bacterium]
MLEISIMGATGSIGQSALQVVEWANREAPPGNPAFRVVALSAHTDVAGLAALALRHRPQIAVIGDESRLPELREALSGSDIECAGGQAAVTEAAARPCDKLLAAISGAAGLASTLAAVRQGTTVALANKESIVCAGRLLLAEARASGARILPVDSEHNAIFQVLNDKRHVEKLTITASGGPFRDHTLERMSRATPDEAKAHPNWDMGVKNSIDSATLMNKALEFIEAAYLFDLPAEQIDVLVHPQSIVHGMAHFSDGSVLAQLGVPDMRTPIAHALAWPERVKTEVARLDLAALARLDFQPVDRVRFPAVDYARQASRLGNAAATVLNGANEAAVAAFIAGECGFLDICWVVGEMLERFPSTNLADMSCESLEEIAYLDSRARELAGGLLGTRPETGRRKSV